MDCLFGLIIYITLQWYDSIKHFKITCSNKIDWTLVGGILGVFDALKITLQLSVCSNNID